LEAAEVAVDLLGIEIVTFVEVGAEATGVLVGCLGCEIVTYGFLSSVEDVVDGCCWMLAVVT
jgi:hypothetical protein